MTLSVNTTDVLETLIRYFNDAPHVVRPSKERSFLFLANSSVSYKFRFLDTIVIPGLDVLTEFKEGRAFITHKRDDGSYDVIAIEELGNKILKGEVQFEGKKGKKKIATIDFIAVEEFAALMTLTELQTAHVAEQMPQVAATKIADSASNWSFSKIFSCFKSFFSSFSRSESAELAFEEETNRIKTRAQQTVKYEQEKQDATIREEIKKSEITRNERRREITKEEVERAEARRATLRPRVK